MLTDERARLFRPRQTPAEIRETAGPLPGHVIAPIIRDPADIPRRCPHCDGLVYVIRDSLAPHGRCAMSGETLFWLEGPAAARARGDRR